MSVTSFRQRTMERIPPRLRGLIELVVIVVVALVLAEAIQATIVKPFKIPSPSMEPTLDVGQRVLVNRLTYRFRSPKIGDIIVFHPPSSLDCGVPVPASEPCPKSVPTPASDYFVKRIVALPGDTLSVRDGHPVVNGKEMTNEPYIAPCGEVAACNMPTTITIPKGEYFVMGDNRGDSDDSRFWGPVPRSWIIGPVFFTYWPPDRIGTT